MSKQLVFETTMNYRSNIYSNISNYTSYNLSSYYKNYDFTFLGYNYS